MFINSQTKGNIGVTDLENTNTHKPGQSQTESSKNMIKPWRQQHFIYSSVQYFSIRAETSADKDPNRKWFYEKLQSKS